MKLRVFTGFFVALVSIFGAFYSTGVVQAAGETCTWTNGGGDGLFSTAANWAEGVACTPSADDNFVFDGAVDADADLDMAAISSLTVAAGYSGSITQSVDTSVVTDIVFAGNGGSYKIADTKVLTLAGSLTVTGAGIFNGDFAASTTVQMTGVAKTIGGDGSTTFDNLTLAGTATLAGHVTSTNSVVIIAAATLDASTFNLAFTAAGTPFITPAGTFTAGTGTVVYNAAGATNIASTSYYSVVINGAGTLLDHTTTTAVMTLTNDGTLDAAGFNLAFTGTGTPFAKAPGATFTSNLGTVIYSGAGATNIASTSYYNLIVSTTGSLLDHTTSTNVLTIADSGSSLAAGYDLGFTAAGTPFVNNGTFTASAGSVSYNNVAATNIATGTYYSLLSGTIGILAGNVTSTNVVRIHGEGSLNLGGYTLNLTQPGTPLVASGTFTASTSTVRYSGVGATVFASVSYYNLVASSTIGILGGNVTSTNVLTINAGSALNLTGYILNLTATGTPLVINGTLTESTSTILYSGAGVTNITTSTYYNLEVNSTDGILGGNVTSTNVLTITAVGALNAGGYTTVLTATGTPFVVSGTLTESTSTFKYMSSETVTTTAESYYNLTLGAGTYNLDGDTTSTGAFINGGTLTIGDDRTLAASGTYNNNGTVTETGAIQHTSESADITDNASTPVADVDTANQIVYLTVEDQDGNLDASAVDTITGSSINASTYGDDESVTLTETGADTGIFRGSAAVALSSLGQDQNGLSELSGNGTFTLAFADSKDAGDTGSDTATYSGSAFNGSSGSNHRGGGGGGGAKISTPNQPVTDPSVIGGPNSQTLSLSDSSAHEIKIGTTVHHVTKVSATDKLATVIVESNPIKFVIRKNEVKKLDTNNDKKFDMSVTYLGFISGVPKFIFTDLLPPKKATTTPVVVIPSPTPGVVPSVTPPVVTVPVTPVVTPSTYQFTKDLRLGSNEKEVEELQKVLKSLGYFTVVPNGNYGPITRASVMKFQKAKGLSQVGVVGPATRAALNALSGVIAPIGVVTPSPVVSVPVQFKRNLVLGSNGADVKALQQILKNLGYFTAVPNGNYGPITREAVIKFQKAKGIAALGYVGPNTRNALNSL